MNALLPSRIRPPKREAVETERSSGHLQTKHDGLSGKSTHGRRTLTVVESCLAFVVLVLWLALFASGILVDTEPYRTAISPGGVTALKAGTPERSGSQQATARNETATSAVPAGTVRNPAANATPSRFLSWFVVLFCFLPINLAWTCAAASTLGAFGNRANLSDDRAMKRSVDNSNPYISAMLRGFFVYLFMTSGLLLLDDAPFSNPAPAQYIRLAGFLSLFSFVVSYQPRLFSTLVVWAFHRIQVREGEDGDGDTPASETLYAKKTTVEEVSASHTMPEKTASPHDILPHQDARDGSS